MDAVVRETLTAPDVHEDWARAFHSRESSAFFDRQFDRLTPRLSGSVLEAGCGLGYHTRRLVDRGLSVTALDFSPSAVSATRQRVPEAECLQADLTELPLADRAFDSVLCYGVLMHIPDVRSAIRELARVTAHTLIVSEGNMYSVDDVLVAVSRRLRRRPPLTRTPAGIENTVATPAGPLFIRHANIPWLVREFETHGLRLARREPGQLSELYTRFPALAKPIHRLNLAWEKHGIAGPAFGNILTFTRPALPAGRRDLP